MVLIKGIQKTSIVDYPDKVACVIFTAGCNFRCPFCHNPDLIEKNRYEKLDTVTEDEFFDFLERRRKWIDGVVVTGGEPCLQEDLPDFLKKVKEKGFLVKLDTNGSNPDMLQKILDKGLADFIAMDIKAPPGSYKKAAGVDMDTEKIKKSIQIIKEAGEDGLDYEFRTTVVPGMHAKEDIKNIGEMLKGSRKIVLQQFKNSKTYDPRFTNVKPYPKKDLDEFKKLLEPSFDEVGVRA